MKAEPSIPDVTLERYRLGELNEAQASLVRESVEGDERVRERLAYLEHSDVELRAAYPVESFAAIVQQRIENESRETRASRRARPAFLPASIGIAAALLAVALVMRVPGRDPGPVSDTDRLKGNPLELQVFRRSSDASADRLESGDVAHAGDVVQIAYRRASHAYGVIVSLDGRGRVTRHLPITGDTAAILKRTGVATLETAYKLDDAPIGERFYFVTSDQPFSVESVLSAVSSGPADPVLRERLPLAPRLSQVSFLLKKE